MFSKRKVSTNRRCGPLLFPSCFRLPCMYMCMYVHTAFREELDNSIVAFNITTTITDLETLRDQFTTAGETALATATQTIIDELVAIRDDQIPDIQMDAVSSILYNYCGAMVSVFLGILLQFYRPTIHVHVYACTCTCSCSIYVLHICILPSQDTLSSQVTGLSTHIDGIVVSFVRHSHTL